MAYINSFYNLSFNPYLKYEEIEDLISKILGFIFYIFCTIQGLAIALFSNQINQIVPHLSGILLFCLVVIFPSAALGSQASFNAGKKENL